MSANAENQSSNSMDTMKWGLVILLLIAVVVANMMFDQLSVLVRAVGFVAAIAVALLIAAQTQKGRDALAFAKESRTEVRKVVWPTRQEAIQTTFIVMIATFIVGLLLWGLDSLMVVLVSFATSLRI